MTDMTAKAAARSIDAIVRKEHGDHTDKEYGYTERVVFGETVRIRKAINIMNLLSIGDERDTAAVIRTMTNMLHEDDQRVFRGAYARQAEITGEELMIILREFVETASDENPSDTSSGSRRITAKRTGRALSAPKSD